MKGSICKENNAWQEVAILERSAYRFQTFVHERFTSRCDLAQLLQAFIYLRSETKAIQFPKKGKERKIYCLGEVEEKDYKEKGNIYLSPVSGRITTALAEKTI